MKNFMAVLALFAGTSSLAQTNYIRINMNGELFPQASIQDIPQVEKAAEYRVDLAFVKKYQPMYSLFEGTFGARMGKDRCFVGDPAEALKIIDAILHVEQDYASVMPASTAVVTPNLVSRKFSYFDDSLGRYYRTASVRPCSLY